jgi:integrase/recombinase XerC
MYRAGIDLTTYPQRGRRPKELDIKELVRQSAMTIKTPVTTAVPAAPAKMQAIKSEVLQHATPAATPSFTPVKSNELQPAKSSIAKFDLSGDLLLKIPAYKDWLAKQGLSAHSARNYLSCINAVTTLVKELEFDYPPLSPPTKDLVARDLKKYLQKNVKLKPATLNSYLSALDNFFGFLGLGKSNVGREDLPQEAPRALPPNDQKKLLRAIELTKRTKDRAIATLLFYTGMRLSECANLELDDLFIVGRNTRAIIRSGKGGRYREVPLNSLVCEVMQAWLTERRNKFAGESVTPAVFLNPQGKPMLPNSIYEIIRKIGRNAGLELSPHILRHTCLTSLVRKQNDIILVADIAGHKSLNTTRRYTLPTAADKAKALEGLLE